MTLGGIPRAIAVSSAVSLTAAVLLVGLSMPASAAPISVDAEPPAEGQAPGDVEIIGHCNPQTVPGADHHVDPQKPRVWATAGVLVYFQPWCPVLQGWCYVSVFADNEFENPVIMVAPGCLT